MNLSSTSPTTTLQIEDTTFTIESDANSILVINSPSDLVSNKPQYLNKDEATSTNSSVLMSESNGYLRQLEAELNKTKLKLEEVTQENVLIKEYNTHLARKLEKKRTITDEDDDTDSIVAYVDVQNIANKLDYYLIETNKIFKTNEDCIDSVKYLIKNIWSLIAHECTEQSLGDFKKVRDELITKLNKMDSEIKENMSSSQLGTNSIDLISNVEVETITNETNTLKEKLQKQNEMLKELKQQIENSKLKTKEKVKEIVKEPVEEPEKPDEDDECNSPSSSPTNLLATVFQKYMNKEKKGQEQYSNEKIKELSLKQDLQETINEPSVHQKVIETTTEPKETIQIQKSKSNDYYLYNSNDFIAVQMNSMDATLVTDEDMSNQARNIFTSQLQSEVPTLFTCPKCKESFDASSFEETDVFITKFENHISSCNERLTCMFCLELFDKNDQEYYEQHISLHLIEN